MKISEQVLKGTTKWTFILIILSFFLTIISLVLRYDITDRSLPFFELSLLAMSDYSFILGIITVGVGLARVFFKKPPGRAISQFGEPTFLPRYQSTKDRNRKPVEKQDQPLFSPGERITIFSGLLSLGFSILISFPLYIG